MLCEIKFLYILFKKVFLIKLDSGTIKTIAIKIIIHVQSKGKNLDDDNFS